MMFWGGSWCPDFLIYLGWVTVDEMKNVISYLKLDNFDPRNFEDVSRSMFDPANIEANTQVLQVTRELQKPSTLG